MLSWSCKVIFISNCRNQCTPGEIFTAKIKLRYFRSAVTSSYTFGIRRNWVVDLMKMYKFKEKSHVRKGRKVSEFVSKYNRYSRVDMPELDGQKRSFILFYQRKIAVFSSVYPAVVSYLRKNIFYSRKYNGANIFLKSQYHHSLAI